MELVLLGTGNPNPDPERSGPSSAIVHNGRAYVVDAGPGVVRRAFDACRRGIPELRAENLNRSLLTHLHSDHTIGLPDFILTPWVMDRDEPLSIWGPPGTEKMCMKILEAYEEDIKVRKNGLEKASDLGIELKVSEISDGIVLEEGDLEISAFSNRHGIWKHSFGYRFETPDRTIVISGDCRPSKNLEKNYMGADILLHEVYSTRGFENLPEKWKKYHRSSHTSSAELAEIVNQVLPKKLVLYHTLLWGASEQDLLDEIGSLYDGEVILGRDLQVFP